jgi:hypothetical protein
MTDSNKVTYSSNLDPRFLNPFEKGIENKMFGYRYGNAQFIYILCAFASLLTIGFFSSDIDKTFIIISLVLYYIFLYYNLSCYLVPDNHERCFVLAWICIVTVIFITILVIFHKSIFRKSKKIGGAHCKKKCKKCKKKGGGDNNKEEKYGGDNHVEELMKNQTGAGSCYKEEKYKGGHKKLNNYMLLDNKLKGGDVHSDILLNTSEEEDYNLPNSKVSNMDMDMDNII